MNAAEITDKLGLHSLRQRAWVCLLPSAKVIREANGHISISNRLAPHPEMVSTRVWNG